MRFPFHREFAPTTETSNSVPPKNSKLPSMANYSRGGGGGGVGGVAGGGAGGVAGMPDGGNYVSRIQNATSNVMGRISGLGRGVGNIGGIANKFLNNLP